MPEDRPQPAPGRRFVPPPRSAPSPARAAGQAPVRPGGQVSADLPGRPQSELTSGAARPATSALLRLARQLIELDYEVAHYAPGELPDQPGEQLLLPLLKAGEARCDLRLICLEDVSAAIFAAQGHELPPAPVRSLQFTLLYPFEIEAGQLPGLARLCLELSRYLPFGCFSVSAIEGLMLRYQLIQPNPEPGAGFDLRLVVDVLDTLAAKSQQLLPAFARYLDGLSEVAEIVAKLAAFAATERSQA